MANIASARKRARTSEQNRLRNASQRSHVRTMIKKVLKAVQSGDKAAASEAYKNAVPAIDRAVSKGVMHANKAARHKARLNSHVRALS